MVDLDLVGEPGRKKSDLRQIRTEICDIGNYLSSKICGISVYPDLRQSEVHLCNYFSLQRLHSADATTQKQQTWKAPVDAAEATLADDKRATEAVGSRFEVGEGEYPQMISTALS